ncbi:hypothetical protein SAMN02745116_00322 [Pilibacter termitis]|uniref:Uncharacterized protein n=1 Tax=Pilibacter termitis TaxID=263852 RepID=A0A1T4KPR9_9ENTE|nr:hypothetical protein [Pilibacter termitis]SJZ44405.1 hypothetical protein SAMN02745116_00322 [Pilibacter termitis]
MKHILLKLLLMLGFSLPTEVLAIYIEHTYFLEIGFVLSVLITFFLAFFAQIIRARKSWILGNGLTLVTTVIFETTVDKNYLFEHSWSTINLLVFIFVVCWLVPQVFGAIWGYLYVSSSLYRNRRTQE